MFKHKIDAIVKEKGLEETCIRTFVNYATHPTEPLQAEFRNIRDSVRPVEVDAFCFPSPSIIDRQPLI